jgi:UDP-glucuronate 4-epimerase
MRCWNCSRTVWSRGPSRDDPAVTILLTGVAGFIGYHVAEALLAGGASVIGVDNLNAYYDVRLKQARLERLRARPGFAFHQIDVADRAAMEALAAAHPDIELIVHLAAQAGVRHSLAEPHAYVQANVMGHLVVLEVARRLPALRHLVYASTSSVYGANQTLPFRETDRVDTPLSLYAATKLADELMSHAYGHLFGIPQTGLRFFTVYGPWGRPDMAYYSFARAIVAGEPITLYDDGRLKRDFTYIDDIVAGVLACLERAPQAGVDEAPPVRVLNIGNHCSEEVRTLVALLERELGRKAVVRSGGRPAADVVETYASVAAIGALTGFAPRTPLAEGVARFAAWFRAFHGG